MNRIAKRLFSAVLAVCAAGAAACAEDFTSAVHPFRSVGVYGDFRVEIASGDSAAVTFSIFPELRDYVQTDVTDGMLRIALDEKNVPKEVRNAAKTAAGKNAALPVVRVCSPDAVAGVLMTGRSELDSVSAAVSADKFVIEFRDRSTSANTIEVSSNVVSVKAVDRSVLKLRILSCERLEVEMNNSAELEIERYSKEDDINLSSASKFSLSGSTEQLDIRSKNNAKATLTGSASLVNYVLYNGTNINAEALENEDSVVFMQGIGKLAVAPSNSLSVNISSGASLNFKGEPELIVVGIKQSTLMPVGAAAEE